MTLQRLASLPVLCHVVQAMTDYIHGFSEAEQQRLVRQAEVLAPNVFSAFDLSPHAEVLELGCGVGAELMLMRQRWPHTS